MASSLTALEKDLTCAICQEIYKEPLILLCSHSFCRACLKENWRERGARECPSCRKRSFFENPPVNQALKSACESFIQERKLSLSAKSQGVLCSEHNEKVHLFCLDDHRLLCASCVSQQHRNHNFCSIARAAFEFKEQLRSPLKLLKDKRSSFSSARMFCNTMASQIQTQAQQTEKQIKEEFEMLHRFLREEEEAMIAALKEEEEEKTKKTKEKLTEFDKILSHIVGKINSIEDYIRGDEHFFLKNLKDAEKSAQCPAVDPELYSGGLIDVAKHLGNLRYRAWKKMKDICPYFPVTLDPNTAKSSATLSEDLSRVSLGGSGRNLPNNPERFSMYNMVLGSEGFTSGSHGWEVEVGQSDHWIIGVAKQSVRRKERFTVGPLDGVWAISLQDGSYSWSLYTGKPQRVRVEVNWEKGRVTFTNPNNNKVLHTYAHKFTERVYPFFCTTSRSPLRILPHEVSVTVEKHKAVACPITTRLRQMML
ncbi:hypothetical protein AOLI_G00233720 [Acnodon oligacanthus]